MVAMRSPRRLAGAALAACCGALLFASCGGSKPSTGTSATTGPTSTRSTGTTSSQNSGAQPTTAQPTGTQPAGTGEAAASGEASAHRVTATVGGVTATLHAGTHKPRVNANWPISFVVRANGKAAKATVEYEYLFGGAVVARRSHYSFKGSFHDVFHWPSSAVGYPLTFRAAIKSEGATLNLDYPVQVVR